MVPWIPKKKKTQEHCIQVLIEAACLLQFVCIPVSKATLLLGG